MATTVNSVRSHAVGGMNIVDLDVTLVTSGTTTTYTFPITKRVYAVSFLNVTTGAINPVGGTFVQSTGVWTSPTMALNDNARVTLITD